MVKSTKKTLQRLKKYQRIDENLLFIHDGCLFYRYCITQVNHNRKSLVVQHLSTKAHKDFLELNTTGQINQLNFEKKNLSEICLEGFVGANIQLYKFRHPAIIKMFHNLDIKPQSESTM